MTDKPKKKRPKGYYSKAAREARRKAWAAAAPERARRKAAREREAAERAKRKKAKAARLDRAKSAADRLALSVAKKGAGHKERLDADRRREAKEARKRAKVSDDDRRAARATDTVIAMGKRHQLEPREVLAALSYREAYDVVMAQMKGTLDPDKAGGSTNTGRMPPPSMLVAAERMADARRILGELLGQVVEAVAGKGYLIEEVAAEMYGRKDDRAARGDREYVGRLFKDGLARLADAWHPKGRERLRVERPADARPVASRETFSKRVPKGEAAHASAHRVTYSGGRR